MSKLSPQLDAIRIKYDLAASDFWELPQRKGTWIVKHSALEKVAALAGIRFEAPQIIEADTKQGIAVMAVEGRMEIDKTGTYTTPQWATGEASPQNNKNAYPWAMAEKRAKDRVILKLTGIEAYSEEEAEDFKRQAGNDAQEAPSEPVQPSSGPLKSSAQAKRDGDWEALKTEIDACQSLEELNLLVASKQFVEAAAPIPSAWKVQMRDYIQTARDEFIKAAGYNFEGGK